MINGRNMLDNITKDFQCHNEFMVLSGMERAERRIAADRGVVGDVEGNILNAAATRRLDRRIGRIVRAWRQYFIVC